MPTKARRRFYIETLGCPKNEVDSEGIGRRLLQAGYGQAVSPAQADVLIVNTCAFIQAAQDESLQALSDLAANKRRDQILVAAGCMPQREDIPLTDLVPRVDGCISTRHWSDVPQLIDVIRQRRGSGRGAECVTWQPADSEGYSLVSPFRRSANGSATAFVKIADGCDAACAFCAIPNIKGPQQSKPLDDIIAEARQLVADGTREIILVGQDTTAYGRDLGMADGLATLLEAILDGAPELAWLRIMYMFPQHITPKLIKLMASQDRICNYVDVPLQHSHPDILARMRRPNNNQLVSQLIGDLRRAMPDLALRTTFIVGYPGETEPEFTHLLEFMEQQAFDKVGVFTYSQETGTAASSLPNQVPEEIKQQRFDRAMTLQQDISLERNQQQVGRILDVLVEGHGDGISVARSYRDAPEIDGYVIIDGIHPANQFLRVRITQGMEYDLVGEILPATG